MNQPDPHAHPRDQGDQGPIEGASSVAAVVSSRAAWFSALVALVALGGLVACGTNERRDVLVMTAASLTDAFAEIEVAFEQENPGLDVRLNIAGSGALREQILQGAPADVFASANVSTMDQVVAAGAASATSVFATNELVIAVPAGNPANVGGVDDLADTDLLVGMCVVSAPCGSSARQALAELGVVPAIDTNEGDVRALLTKIAAGELDAGIVYATDVDGAPVDFLALPTSAQPPIDYPIAVLSDAPNPEGARLFEQFVQSASGQQILAEHGFGRP